MVLRSRTAPLTGDRRHRALSISMSMSLGMLVVCFASASLVAQSSPGSIVSHPLLVNGPSVIDAAGNTYTTTTTTYPGLMVTPGAAQTQFGGATEVCGFLKFPIPCTDAYIAKVDASGRVVFATYLGGSAIDGGNAVAVDAAGNVYVTGYTNGPFNGFTPGPFPTTPNAAIPISTSSTAFAAKLSADGSTFIYSTYLPATVASVSGIAVDLQGNAYVVGKTTTNHACVIKLSADGSAFVYTTVLGGTNREFAIAVVADAAGNAVV